jgi:2,4-dienoyl-CoA reductase-like NADH-dependent reductase (Old Yellow Enzyme family)
MVSKPKPDNPERKRQTRKMVAKRLEGKPYQTIAEETGVSIATVSRRLAEDEAKAILEQGQADLVEMVPTVVNNYREFLADEDKTIRLKASQDITKITGITPTHTQSVYINNLYQTANVIVGGPAQDALRKALGMQLGLDYTDVTPEADDGAESDV